MSCNAILLVLSNPQPTHELWLRGLRVTVARLAPLTQITFSMTLNLRELPTRPEIEKALLDWLSNECVEAGCEFGGPTGGSVANRLLGCMGDKHLCLPIWCLR